MKDEAKIIQLVEELAGRWIIPILLSMKQAGRFTQLQHQLGISPSRLSDNLKKLIDRGFVYHLSPYERRHPLLPEYQLTEQGLLLHKAAQIIKHAETHLEQASLSRKAWSWPILLAVYQRYDRFGTIRQLLPEATPRMLSIRLDELHKKQLIEKKLIEIPRLGYQYQLSSSVKQPIHKVYEELLVLLQISQS